MSPLRFPLKDHLSDPVDEAAILRVGARISSRTRTRRLTRFWPLMLVGATAFAGAVLMVSRAHRDAGPLLLASGRELVTTVGGPGTDDLALSDGSHVHLSPGARFEPLESTGSTLLAVVSQGRAEFDVHPGGPRRWVIECGLATVEVVGTSFSCDRQPGQLLVEVSRGVVLVRGERVPGRARRLSAGERLLLQESEPDGRGPQPARAASEAPAAGVTDDGPRSSPPPRSHARVHAKTWQDLARVGRNREAFASLGNEGLRREASRLGVSDLLALADMARLSGHPAEAVIPLERILGEFAGDAQAPLAAFALGRLQLDALGHPQAAASAFAQALALNVPAGLREDVRARLVEAYARTGDARATQVAADGYLAEFPHGRHVQAIQASLRPR